LLEVLFDGKLEAAADVESQAVRHTATPAKERERPVVTATARPGGWSGETVFQ